MSASAIALPKNTGQKRSKFGQHNLVGYLFISPWLIAFFLFTLIPILASLLLSFTDYNILGSWKFVGVENFYRMFFEDRRFWRSVEATVTYVIFSVPLRLIFALGVAMLLNTSRRGIGFYRAAFYAPSIVGGSIAVAVMWRQIFGNDGLLNYVLGIAGLEGTNWLGRPETAIWTLILLAAWQFGSPMLIFLAGLKNIPSQLYESADIDGANGWQKFLRITLPMLTPIIFFNLIMQLISGFMVFTQAFIITGGRPLDTTMFYALYIYRRAFETFEMGYASAMAWVMLLVIALLTAVVFRTSSYWVYYEADEGN
ncbi:MAG: sugar ABC transporter permease [Anaerolineae bacterium]|nr:sugar ABC transporter permease [Anaerolineae bacterium]